MSVVGSDQPPHRRSQKRPTIALRRWFAKNPSTPPAASDLSADLVADIVAMTRQAALDGLPLSAVLDDLRLVLELEPADVLPVDALRACALEWGHATMAPGTSIPAAPVTLNDLECHLWRLLGSSPDQLPERVVVVRLRTFAPDEDARGSGIPGVLDSADLLVAAARVMSHLFNRPGEHVALLRSPLAVAADRVVALVPGQEKGDGPGDKDRMALFEASLASAPVIGAAPWLVEVHVLAGHPRGLVASMREALDPV